MSSQASEPVTCVVCHKHVELNDPDHFAVVHDGERCGKLVHKACYGKHRKRKPCPCGEQSPWTGELMTMRVPPPSQKRPWTRRKSKYQCMQCGADMDRRHKEFGVVVHGDVECGQVMHGSCFNSGDLEDRVCDCKSTQPWDLRLETELRSRLRKGRTRGTYPEHGERGEDHSPLQGLTVEVEAAERKSERSDGATLLGSVDAEENEGDVDHSSWIKDTCVVCRLWVVQDELDTCHAVYHHDGACGCFVHAACHSGKVSNAACHCRDDSWVGAPRYTGGSSSELEQNFEEEGDPPDDSNSQAIDPQTVDVEWGVCMICREPFPLAHPGEFHLVLHQGVPCGCRVHASCRDSVPVQRPCACGLGEWTSAHLAELIPIEGLEEEEEQEHSTAAERHEASRRPDSSSAVYVEDSEEDSEDIIEEAEILCFLCGRGHDASSHDDWQVVVHDDGERCGTFVHGSCRPADSDRDPRLCSCGRARPWTSQPWDSAG